MTIFPQGGGGSRQNGPRTISKYFFIFEPFPNVFQKADSNRYIHLESILQDRCTDARTGEH